MVDLFEGEDELGMVDLGSDLGPLQNTPDPNSPSVAIPTAQPIQSGIPTAQPIQGSVPTAQPVQGGIPTATPIQGPAPTTGPENPPASNSNVAKSEHLTDTDLDNFLNGFQL